MIDHKRKLILVHIARTGGSSVEKALVGQDWWYVDSETKHLSASQSKNLYARHWNEYTKFSIVRNTWDRMVSLYNHGAWGSAISFHEFLTTLKPHPREKYQSLHYHEILDEPMDYVLRFENLEKDLSNMLNQLGHDAVPLPHEEKREHAPYQTYYDDQTVSWVAETFKKDIEMFGFSRPCIPYPADTRA